jgi:hypothetical protein
VRRIAAENLQPAQEMPLTTTPIKHYHCSTDRLFTAEERDRVTILFGGFTWKHERFVEAILRGSGYRCQMLPNPNVAAYSVGKEYGNNGQCNSTYFTIGIRFSPTRGTTSAMLAMATSFNSEVK